jgi:putative PIN family toxin of toxin-antitoxin system
MIRAVLDTNVLVSAAIKKEGKPDRILRQAVARFEWLTSEFILAEITEVLTRRHLQRGYPRQLTAENRALYLAMIRSTAQIVEVGEEIPSVVNDPEDNPVLACAVCGQADYLVTGDPHLLKLGTYEGVKMITPAQFLKILEEYEG